jgi:mitochondrial translocator assembly and maintenance protein 41
MATCATLLQLPQRFTEMEFYYKVCELSYLGDIRIGIAENPNKIQNIIQGSQDNLQLFHKLYHKHLVDFSTHDDHTKVFTQNKDAKMCSSLLHHLPVNVRREVYQQV